RPANAGAYLPEADLGKLKTIFWRFNIMSFAPVLDVPVDAIAVSPRAPVSIHALGKTTLIGTWYDREVPIPDGTTYETGIEKTNPWWHVEGKWFQDDSSDCVVGAGLAKRYGVKLGDILNVAATDKSTGMALTVVGVLTTGGPEDDAIVASLATAQQLANKPGQYRRLYVSALTKPEDAFARKDPKTMTPAEFDTWYCTPYISAIALQISEELKGTDVHVIRRVAEGEGIILTRVRTLLWLVTFAALLASALAVGASAAASVIERRTEIGLMKALGAGSGLVGVLLAA